MRRMRTRELGRSVAVAAAALAVASILVAVLQAIGVSNASIVYIAAVVVIAVTSGTSGAVLGAVASFVLYDFLFISPVYTLTVSDPAEWLSLVLLLFVGIVVGQLAALQRSRAQLAVAREREARALFQVSRALVTRESTSAALPTVAGILCDEGGMERVRIALGPDDARERVAADTDPGARWSPGSIHLVLRRMPGDEPANWVRVHQAGPGSTGDPGRTVHRVRIEAGGSPLGSIWAWRDRQDGEPGTTETRLLAAAADQVGQALAHDVLTAEAQAAEIARQSDALKSALLQSVSHDLRTPLATIRAAAGTLRPDASTGEVDRRENVEAIDREVEYLDRLVTNLLDLSRIEAGALRAEPEVFELDDLVRRTVERLATRLQGRPLDLDLAAAPVLVDPVFLDEAVTNALDNAVKYTSPDTTIRVTARPIEGGSLVRLTIEDAGAGVPDEVLGRLFEKFYRVPGPGRPARSGTGIGLAVVRGLVEAMGGRSTARRSGLGGLAIDLDLPAASPPNEESS
jgi:two-component system sensor histidine kinase KdpD